MGMHVSGQLQKMQPSYSVNARGGDGSHETESAEIAIFGLVQQIMGDIRKPLDFCSVYHL